MTAVAPGSVFISGEYLILDGEPALVSAVDRYATAESVLGGYVVEGLPGSPDMRLPFAVCEVLGIHTDVLAKIKTSITGFGAVGKKYGLSSSAASCVALVRMLSPTLSANEVLDAAGRAHRRFQNGKGSNADVQLAVSGGTSIVFSQGISDETPTVVPFPTDLKCAVVWMEASAKTVSFISKFESAKTDTGFKDVYGQMKINNLRVIDAFAENRSVEFLKALSSQDDLLDQLGKIIDAPIRVNAHNDLKNVCGDSFVAKVSGSGGGDISLVFGPVDADWAGLFDRLPATVQLLEIGLDAHCDRKK